MLRFKPILLLFFLTTTPVIVVAQELGINGSSQFRRQLDSFFWVYDVNFQRSTDSYSILFNNRFNSRFYYLGGSPQNIQDENAAGLNFTGVLTDRLGYIGEARSVRFSTTNVNQDWFLAGLTYRPIDQLNIAGLGGVMRDKRSNINDSGYMAGLRAETAPIEAGEFSIQSNLHVDYADISPRTYQTYRLNSFAILESEDFTLETDLQLARNVRDSYQASSFFNRQQTDFVESINTDTSGVNLTAYFPVFDFLQGRLDFGALNNVRTVTNSALFPEVEGTLFDTRILRQRLDVGFQTMLPVNNSTFTLGFNYSINNRDASLINTDDLPTEQVSRRSDLLANSNFDQTRFELFTNNRFFIGSRNTTQLAGRISIMNYDTPESNRDDRDELFMQLRVANSHEFNDYFRTAVTLAGEATHTVYLFAERSIENNWRRSIRLIPEFEWDTARWLRLRSQMLVRANYTVDDFNLPGRQNNDQVSREFGIQLQAEITLASEWWLELTTSRNELRIGRLLWDEFKEIPTDTLITYDNRAMITHQRGNLTASVGMRYFLKYDYLPQATITIETELDDGTPTQQTRIAPGKQTTIQWGPVVEMRLPLYRRNELIVNGWYQMQSNRRELYIEYPEEFASEFRQEERRVARRNYPNLEVMARFWF